jgi:hypothetical protein
MRIRECREQLEGTARAAQPLSRGGWAWPHKSWKIVVIWTSVFVIHALVYLAVIPPWQAPDEPTSFELLLTMEARNRFVGLDDTIPKIQHEIIASMERHHFWDVGGYGGRPLTDDDRNFRTIWSCCYTQLNRPPLYHLLLLPIAKPTIGWPVERRLLLLRLMTILLSAVTVAVVARIGHELTEFHPAIRWILPAFVSLSPQFAYMSATFNSDNLAALLGSLVFWRLLRLLREGMTARSLAELSLLVVLGIGARRTTLLVVPALLCALVWQFIVTHRGRNEESGSKFPVAVGGGLAALCIVIASVPALRSPILQLIGQYVFKDNPAGTPTLLQQISAQQLTIWSWLGRNTEFLNLSFWGSFGWHAVHIAPLIGHLLLALLVASWISALIWLLRSRRMPPPWGLRFACVCGFAVIVTIPVVVIGTPPEVLPQGRYLFPVMVPIFLLTTIGICSRLPRRYELLSVSLIVSALLALDVYSIWMVVMPAYLP